MAQVKDRLGHLINSGELTMEKASKTGQTPWVWLKCTKRLSANTPENRALKEIGFLWSKKRCQWYHTCEDKRAWRPRYSAKKQAQPEGNANAASRPAALTLSASSTEEFEKLFGIRP